MIITASTAAVSHSTDPSAAAVTAGFRSASFRPAARADESHASACAPLDVDRLYPSLRPSVEAPKVLRGMRAAIATLRRALAAPVGSFTTADPNSSR
jgi:hypothetical protein